MTEKKRFVASVDESCIVDNLDNKGLYSVVDTVECLNTLNDENEQLRTKNNAYIQDIEVFKEENTQLKLNNVELKQRNNQQAKRLAELYELMAKKDWESLTEIIDDFCSCEEQLQREWGTYE